MLLTENTILSELEIARYQRHIVLPEINLEGQKKLKSAKVLVVGAGGLGCPILSYLAAAGVGNIGIIDFDVIDVTNLQRQVLYSVSDVGKPKIEIAKQRLTELNPCIDVKGFNLRLSNKNALEIISQYDIIADGSDNFHTRYLINDACVITDKALVYGSVFKFEGQVTVFNHTDKNGKKGPTYRCLFPQPPNPETVPNCSEAGVLGVLPGLIGCMQANETIKIITGIGEVLSGKLIIFNALKFETRSIKIERSTDQPLVTKLVDYEQYCLNDLEIIKAMKEITVTELKARIDSKEDFQLIDVREQYEYEICNLGGELIPVTSIPSALDKISKDKPVIIHCRSGGRSSAVVNALEQQYGFSNLYNLKGGIMAWSNEIDPSVPKY